MPSEAIENYLKAIYKLERDDERASTGQVAKRLGISAPSASRMMKRLSEAQLVERSPYQGVRLTDKGRVQALRVIRNHRILESYLVKVLGMSWDRVDGEVERIEHVVSDELINRMEEALGYPRVDPHGSPIPGRDGSLPELDGTVALPEVEPGERARVSRVVDAPSEALAHLESRGMKPGTELLFVRQEPFHGPLVLEINGEERVLGIELARRVQVVVL
ncbi:MAG: metal-dependent transcriptional regulator [Planctomycetota bacterium]